MCSILGGDSRLMDEELDAHQQITVVFVSLETVEVTNDVHKISSGLNIDHLQALH